MSRVPSPASDHEAQLAVLLARHARPERWELRHPWVVARAAWLLRCVPVLTYRPSQTREGEIIRTHFVRSLAGVSTAVHQARTVLSLPTQPGQYDQGRDRATQRRHARKAVEMGITCRRVTGPEEKRRLLQLAVDHERNHPTPAYRDASPSLGLMLEIDLWLVAEHEGVPVLLSITAIDGDWALMSYFRTLQASRAATAARYWMTGVLAEELVTRGVRHLSDTKNAFRLNPGVRHFSRMVGFRTRRVRVL